MGLLISSSKSESLPFSLKSSKLHKCKVESVIDGDTIKVVFRPCFFSKWFTFNVVLLDCKAPQIRTKDLAEKEKGVKARNYLFNVLVKQPNVFIECGNFDSFGRLQGHVFLDNKRRVSVNELVNEYLQNTLENTDV